METNTDIWKVIPGFSMYECSNKGTIRRIRSRKGPNSLIKPSEKEDGYLRVSLQIGKYDKASMYVHRITAITFIPNPEKKPTVNHINHNKHDNCVENLEWATITEQNRHRKKPSREKQRLMSSRKINRISLDGKILQSYETGRDAAEWVFNKKLTSIIKFNNGNNIKTRITAVCRKKRKTAFGYRWEYDTFDEDKYVNEIWKDVPPHLIGDKKGYKVSDQGRIRNHHGKISEPYHKPGDNYCNFSVYPKQYSAHRLICSVFLPNIFGKEIVHHKDHDKTNCRLYNLQWATASENVNFAIRHYASLVDNYQGGISKRNNKYSTYSKPGSGGERQYLGIYDTLEEAKRIQQQFSENGVNPYVCLRRSNGYGSILKLQNGRFSARRVVGGKSINLGQWDNEVECDKAIRDHRSRNIR